MQVTESQTKQLLCSSKDEQVKAFAKDTALIKALSKVLTASLNFNPNQVGLSLAKKTLSVSGVAEKATSSTGLKATNFVANQAVMTIGLIKVAGYTPGKAAIFITLTVAEKIVSAAGLGEVDKCKMAIASLAVSTGLGAFTCAGTLGIGCIAGAISIAAAAFDTYGQCKASPIGSH